MQNYNDGYIIYYEDVLVGGYSYIVNNPAQALKDFNRKIKHLDTSEEQIKGLLKFLKKKNAGDVQLYQSDSYFQNWKQKYLDGKKNVKSKDC
ncbi:MAG: hypothetical protein EOO93_05375 [Pedobacter sp.]|nr:MAG: hypothetical protein EOO93_05375 [Pedobacter sp.]